MPKLIKGENLTPEQKRHVLNAYIYRNTFENKERSQRLNPTCKIYVSDAQWINEHAFYFNNDGSLSGRHKHCEPAYLAN